MGSKGGAHFLFNTFWATAPTWHRGDCTELVINTVIITQPKPVLFFVREFNTSPRISETVRILFTGSGIRTSDPLITRLTRKPSSYAGSFKALYSLLMILERYVVKFSTGMGFEPPTLWSHDWGANHWAMRAHCFVNGKVSVRIRVRVSKG